TEAGDHERALAYLEAWRVRRPVGDDGAGRTMGEAYLAAGAAAAEAGRLRRALDHYRAAAAFGRYASRQLYLLQPIAVLESLREGDVECARFLLDGITTTYPHPATPVFLQAVVSHVSGEVAQAVSKYSEAARLAAAKAASRPGVAYDVAKKYATATLRAAIARPPQEGVKRWRSIFLGPLERSDDGRHFVVFAPAKAQAEKIAASADRIYETIARDLLGRIPNASKAEIVVHANRQAYVAADPEPPGSPVRGVTVPRQKTGGLCYDTLDEHGKPLVRVETYPVADWTKSTLPHEIVHVVQRRGLAVFRQGKWLDEGLAMLYESRASQQNRLALWRTLAKARIPLPELLALRSIPPARATLFYAESHAFAAFLRSLGDEQDWRDFLREYTRQDFPNAIRSVYEIESVEVLERMWIEKGTRLR
ncbi:MAG: hypothetical protein OER88_14795, partial [Planctomycetota bacterium]|nr:hypothetical protein [Planctomycetota bacterium]